jgi:hypothetical protein
MYSLILKLSFLNYLKNSYYFNQSNLYSHYFIKYDNPRQVIRFRLIEIIITH